jgi:YegS/Rv2252/BmrU family lipid kinase
MSNFVADNVAEACQTVRPPAGDENPSNKTDDVTQGAAALTPSANSTNGDQFKKEGHRSGGLHIPNFLRGRRARRNSMSSPSPMESPDLSSGGDSGDDLSDVEFDEELDKKLKEEVEKDLPASITDLSKAERTNVRKIYLLYNPMSGNKRGKRVARKATRLLEREGVVVDMVRLTARGHAAQLCETLDLDGYDVVVGVGGDGTFHECINGMMKRSLDLGQRAVPLALIAAGTGNSFMHELRCYKLKAAIYHIVRGVNYPIDICRLTFGDGSSCYSFNSVHWGIASKIMLTAEKLRWMGHAMRYTTACFMEIIGGDKARLARIVVTDENDKEVEYNDKFIVAIANNIITASRGMKMAPQAKIDDGLIDLLLIKATSTLNLLDVFRRTYDGSHTELPYVIYQKVKKFTITPFTESNTGELEEVEEIIDVDGELKGCTPFTCEVLPQVLRIVL